jgi:tetratricopeptide (TPR) repeat protein
VIGISALAFGGKSDDVASASALAAEDEPEVEATEGAQKLAARPQEKPKAPSPTATEAAAAPSDPEDEGEDEVALFRVKTAGELESCEVLLTHPLSFYQGKPSWEGQAIWKRARQQLLVGERDAAHQLMCQAAFIDPSGPASVGLAGYYLANRSLKNAEQWALYGIEQRPDFPRKSQELLGDTLSQMGKVDEARDIWLKTMKLDRDDSLKLRAVARTLTSSAQKTRRGGDYPLAERLLRRAVAFDEENPAAAAALAGVLLKNDQPALAKKWAQRALSLNANSGEALYVLGEIALTAGDQAEAKRNFSQVPDKSTYSKEAQERLKSF